MLVIPVFIPHQGCPRQCRFCNQVSISGERVGTEDDTQFVRTTIQKWLQRSRKQTKTQVAFFGGSFTCLPVGRMQTLLQTVQPFIEEGAVQSIRLSTRPDCIDETVLEILHRYHVTTVELGVQSLDDTVLQASWRGHSSRDCVEAAALIKQRGFELGVQLMPGLPKETTRSWLATVHAAIRLQPACVRIYPTLVVQGAQLALDYRQGKYTPLTMNKAIAYCHRAKALFESAGITILRMGLQATEDLEEKIVAGPYHPSFGERVVARDWFLRSRKILAAAPLGSHVIFTLSHRDVSAFVGPHRANIRRLETLMAMEKGQKRFEFTTDTTFERGTLKYVIA